LRDFPSQEFDLDDTFRPRRVTFPEKPEWCRGKKLAATLLPLRSTSEKARNDLLEARILALENK
jgi:hypothetical protein